MKKLRSGPSSFQQSCQSVYDDDGVDPRRYFRNEKIDESGSKCRRFCGYVAKTLNVVFAGCSSQVLARLFVVRVLPAPTSSRLEVVIDTTQVESGVTSDVIRMELDRASQHLRAEVGKVIVRKYVPELFFRLASPDEVLQ